jgi:hypothetical protein
MDSSAEQSWLHDFLSSPPSIRQQMAEEAEALPTKQPYLRVLQQATAICRDY